MRILITGCRYAGDAGHAAVFAALSVVKALGHTNVTVVHGAAPGIDRIAEDVALGLGFEVERHPADWTRGRRAGPERNQRVVDAGADMCFAFPGPTSRGTHDCRLRAQAAGIQTLVIPVR